MLRKMFGDKKDEVIGEWRRLHSEELHDVNSAAVKKGNRGWDGMGRACSTYGGSGKPHTGFGRKSKGRRTFGLA